MNHSARRLLWGLLWLALGLGAWWLRQNMEEVDVKRWRAMRDEARSDPYYGLKKVSAALQVPLTVVSQLGSLPDTRTTLVLDTPFWDLFPEKVTAIKDWVARGGHLVVLNEGDGDAALKTWLPQEQRVRGDGVDADDDGEDDDASAAPDPVSTSPVTPMGKAQRHQDCPDADESGPEAPWLGEPVALSLCNANAMRTLKAADATQTLWRLEQAGAVAALRLRHGQGSITRVTAHAGPLFTLHMARPEQLRAVAAVMQWQTGRPVWVISGEATQEHLLKWLWHRSSAGLLFLALALGLWTWRRAMRFGPLLAEPPLARRSMAEQIRGSAAFLLRHRSPALHSAALQALQTQVRQTLPATRRLPQDERWQHVARHSQVDAAALLRAVQLPAHAPAGEQAAALLLLESVRRRLQQRPPASPPTSTDAL